MEARPDLELGADSNVHFHGSEESSSDLDEGELEPWQLGFAEPIDGAGETMARGFFPSKIGGHPAWLDPVALPLDGALDCGNCSEAMPFLLQIYAPRESPASAFHRVVYVWACKKGGCNAAPGAVRALSCTLAQDNPYYTREPPARMQSVDHHDECEGHETDDDDESEPVSWALPCPGETPLCLVCGRRGSKRCGRCRQVTYCCKAHQQQDWARAHKAECGRLAATQPGQPLVLEVRAGYLPSSYREFELAIDSEVAALVDGRAAAKSVAEAHPSVRAAQGKSAKALAAADALAAVAETARASQASGAGTSAGAGADAGAVAGASADPSAVTATAAATAADGHSPKLAADATTEEVVSQLAPAAAAATVAAAVAAVETDEAFPGDTSKKDPVFVAFRQRIRYAPEQVIRYVRTRDGAAAPEPLWVVGSGALAPGDVPPCEHCGAPRVFEFQILPQLLFYALNSDVEVGDGFVDWATIVVYTCARSCTPVATPGAVWGAYKPEFTWRQPFPHELGRLGLD